MPRDASGNMTLPPGNPVVTGTAISSAVHNATTADLAAEVQDSLSRSGKGGMLAPFKNADGSESAPGIAFTAETNTGFFRNAAGDLRVAILGVWKLAIKAASIVVNNIPIKGLADPTEAQDAATKNYVDTASTVATITASAGWTLNTNNFKVVKGGKTVSFTANFSSADGTGSITDLGTLPVGYRPYATDVVSGAYYFFGLLADASLATKHPAYFILHSNGTIGIVYYGNGVTDAAAFTKEVSDYAVITATFICA